MTIPTQAKLVLKPRSFVAASFARCGHDDFARVLEKRGLLDFYALGTRRGTKGVPLEHTRLKPVFGLLNYAFARWLSPFQAESWRFRLFPWFDRWVKSLMRPGQHLLTSYAFANSAMEWTKAHGGTTFIDAGNSHPEAFWNLLTEEQRKWQSPYPPVARHYNRRGLATAQIADYIFTPSTFVRNSFLQKGYDPNRILLYTLPLDLHSFKPAMSVRPKGRPLTLITNGSLCLRKGTPYVLEAFRIIRSKEPTAILRLTRNIADDVRSILNQKYADLPMEWVSPFNFSNADEHRQYVERLQSSDIFVFPSLEDGFAFVVAEALACGLPVITTKNTGASDLVTPGENGEIVPIRDPDAIADAVLKWWRWIQDGKRAQKVERTHELLSFERFEMTVMGHLERLAE